MLVDDRELTARAAEVEALLAEIENFPDPAVRARVAEIVGGILALYGEGLARMLAILRATTEREVGMPVLDAFAGDELVEHLLLLHDLHPVDLHTRVTRALEEVRPYLESHGGNVELLAVEDGVARVRLQGSCSGCPSSTMTLKLAIEEAIQRAAPELVGVEAEGVTAPPASTRTIIPIGDLLPPRRDSKANPPGASLPGSRPSDAAWIEVAGLSNLAEGSMTVREIAGRPAIFLQLDGTLYAYQSDCPHCGGSLAHGDPDGIREETAIACPGCGNRYDIRHAGKCLDLPERHLEPIPLLRRGETVRVATHGN